MAAGAVVTVTAARHSRPAVRLTACGPGQVRGYSNQRTYPPGIPTFVPPGAHVVACFATAALAALRGFAVASPPGTLIVRGVFLEPTGSRTVRQCRVAAGALGYAVPCPTVAPVVASIPLQLPNCNDGGGCVVGRRAGFTFSEQNFAVPPHYHAFGGSSGYFVLLASRDARVPASQCASGLLIAVRRVRVSADNAAIYACPLFPGSHSRYVILTWTHQGVHVSVSFAGENTTNIDLDLAIASHLVWVSPAS